MMKNFLLVCLTILFGMQGAAAAKDKGLPEEQRIKIAVEVTNSSRYKNLPTAKLLEDFLIEQLVGKNFVNVLDKNVLNAGMSDGETLDAVKPFDNERNLDASKTADENETSNAEETVDENGTADDSKAADTKATLENIGSILVFDAVELPADATLPEDFDADAYRDLGAAYVVHCEVLGLGATKVNDKTVETVSAIIGDGLSWSGSGSSDRDKTLRRVGTGVAMLGYLGMTDITKRTALNTVVKIQFINVETGEVVWQDHFIGQAIKHHGAKKGYSDAWEQAYSESVENSAKLIAKRVNKYVDKVIVRGKSDKSFLPKKLPLGKGLF